MKYRIHRASELIKRELGVIITRDLMFGGAMVTVHQVSLTPDLRKAHVHVSAIGGDFSPQSIVTKLTDERPHLQREISKRVILKYTPVLEFHYDESVERGARVLSIMEELEQSGGPAEEK
jgi:ribosome-binding factor A